MVDFCVRLDHRYEHRVARSTVTLVTNQPSRLPDYLHKPAGKYDLDGQPIHCGFEGTTDDYAWSEDTSEELLQRVGLSIEKVEEEPVLASPSVLVECQSDYVFNQHELTEAFEEIGVGPLRERFRLARSIRKPRRFLNIFMGLCAKMGDRYSYDAPNPRNLGDIFHHPAPLPGLQLAICNIPVWGPGYKKHQAFSRGAGKSWIEHMKQDRDCACSSLPSSALTSTLSIGVRRARISPPVMTVKSNFKLPMQVSPKQLFSCAMSVQT